MGENSKIEWTDATWNPVTGCTKVSPGCDNCYAERIVERFKGKGAFAQVTLNEERLAAPLKWRKPRRVFVNSMSDLFHDDVPDDYIARVFAVMAATPQHTYQILTKRHARMRSLLNSPAFNIALDLRLSESIGRKAAERVEWPLPNVWLGVSVEDQKWADIRIPALLETPAAVRFLSCEPLLGPVTLWDSLACDHPRHPCTEVGCWRAIDWVIVGGESGPGARPMHPDWARSLRDQCAAAGTAFFFKQWGTWAPADVHGWYSRSTWVDDEAGRNSVFMYAAKSKSLRDMDGRTWDEYPVVSR